MFLRGIAGPAPAGSCSAGGGTSGTNSPWQLREDPQLSGGMPWEMAGDRIGTGEVKRPRLSMKFPIIVLFIYLH